MSPTVCLVVGARPNFMKTAPVLRALTARGIGTTLVHTGQHYDPEMSAVFLDELGLPTPDVFLGVGSGTHAQQTAAVLVGIEPVLAATRPDLVVVPGDVNSTLAAALASVKLGLAVCHLEAGLRSFDRSMPEEHNRIVADHVSDLLLTHSPEADDNLRREGIPDSRIVRVGNTMIDSLLTHVGVARSRAPWERFGVEPKAFGLVTLHRPRLVDDPSLFARTIRALGAIAASTPLVFPVHPRTAQSFAGLEMPQGLLLTPPLGYLDFLGLEAEAAFVLTDSGGVQEETTALGVPCLTLRDTTERPVTVTHGTNTLLGLDPERLEDVRSILEDLRPATPVPLWDGHAGERAAAAIAAFLAH